MREFTFTAYCNFGKGDSGESWIDVELTDEEAARLVKYGAQTETYFKGFSECKELKDLYQKIYAIAVDQITDELRDLGGIEGANDPDWKANDTYPCGVNFPLEFEELLPDEE